MLDSFEVLSTSGVVLWSKAYSPVSASIVNSLIKDVFIEETTTGMPTLGNEVPPRNPIYKKDKYTLKWRTAKDLGLIFVAVYQSIIHLSWVDKLLDNVKILFISLYREQFQKPNTTVIECPFDEYFGQQVRDLENTRPDAIADPIPGVRSNNTNPRDGPSSSPQLRPHVAASSRSTQDMSGSEDISTDVTPVATPDTSRPSTPASSLLVAKASPGSRVSRKDRKRGAGISSKFQDEGRFDSKAEITGKKKGVKTARKWNDDGMPDEDDGVTLDYSAPASEVQARGQSNSTAPEAIAEASWAKRTGKGEVVLRDLGEEMNSILTSAHAEEEAQVDNPGGLVNSGLGAIGNLFRNVVGGKTLSVEDLGKPLKGMQEHLIKKNVAQDAAIRLCDAVSRDLVGTKTPSFQSINTSIQSSMEKALVKILTPTTSLDLLRSISAVTANSKPGRRPYVISIVGVNGVGKSTTLAKLAFLLLHNNHRVLVCGADTFRSGAVEQLRVHVRNLQQLTSSSDSLGSIDLYERGYGKDPAHIARDAVLHAQTSGLFDVVLIDTAGRRHNDTRLMSSLENFAKLAAPDKIFMVGEALVGTDSVAQARHFNASFGPGKGLDGFIVSKCDTVGEMVGTVVSLVFATGVPVVAVGVGQHYGDLRTLNVKWAMRLLMQ